MSAAIATVQESERPLQPPPVQPFHVAPALGAAVTVTTVPSRKLEPPGLLLAEPEPFVLRTSLYVDLNVAVTGASEFTLKVHVVLIPLQVPPSRRIRLLLLWQLA